MSVTLSTPTFDWTAPALRFAANGDIFTIDSEGNETDLHDLNLDSLGGTGLQHFTLKPGPGFGCSARIYYQAKPHEVVDSFNDGGLLEFVRDDQSRIFLQDKALKFYLLRLTDDGWRWVTQLAGEECGELVVGEPGLLDKVYRLTPLRVIAPLGPRSRLSPLAERRLAPVSRMSA